jgi:cell division septal protein FtsQ
MWFSRKQKNRRLGRYQVLDVKLRSSQVRAARTRLVAAALGVSLGTVLGLYLLWRAGEWTLDRLVYENKTFSIQQIEVQNDAGVIMQDQLRRLSGVRPGQNLLALDLARVKRDLEMEARIQSASVERVLPGTLRIRVTEREAVAQVNVVHPRAGGGIDVLVFQLDAEGYVMTPLDPRQRMVLLNQADEQLPQISGMDVSELQPGRRVQSPQTLGALQFIAAYDSSAMTSIVDVKRIDVSSPQVLVVTTGQGSLVTFALQNFEKQLMRWQKIHEECLRQNKIIGTLDLAVNDNTPLRFMEAGVTPPTAPKTVKPQRIKKKNV